MEHELSENPSIGEYLLRRLEDYGIRDVFGIPGDYILSFYTLLEQSPLRAIGCTREDCAGFAADAYARINGMGAVCVTYCVGGLSVCNPLPEPTRRNLRSSSSAARRGWRSESTIPCCITRCVISGRRPKSSRSSASPARN